jgi:hypothetical protein
MTYSLGVTAINANSRYTPLTLNVSDADSTGDVVSNYGPSQQTNMRSGAQVLCKNPDGSQSYYVIDAERSVPGVSLVMRPVGP